MANRVTVAAFINQIYELDQIRISIAMAPMALVDAPVQVNRANDDTRVDAWINNRVRPRLPMGTNVTVYLVTGQIAKGHELIRFCRPH